MKTVKEGQIWLLGPQLIYIFMDTQRGILRNVRMYGIEDHSTGSLEGDELIDRLQNTHAILLGTMEDIAKHIKVYVDEQRNS